MATNRPGAGGSPWVTPALMMAGGLAIGATLASTWGSSNSRANVPHVLPGQHKEKSGGDTVNASASALGSSAF